MVFRRLRTRGAFTLIELLVVVSIIALLVAIMLPALGKARQQSNTVVCQTRIRGLGLGIQTYLSEFEYTFPLNGLMFPKCGGSNTSPTTGYGNGVTDRQQWDLPYGLLWPYMNKDRKTYICPQDYNEGMPRSPNNARQDSLFRDPNALNLTGTINLYPGPGTGYWSYTLNTVLNSEGKFRNNFRPRNSGAPNQQPWIDPLKANLIAQASNFIFLIEEDKTSNFNDEVFDPPAYNGGDFLSDRHNHGGNIGFADNHIEWFSQVMFDNVPSGSGGNENYTAMLSPYTRMFFPDNGSFALTP